MIQPVEDMSQFATEITSQDDPREAVKDGVEIDFTPFEEGTNSSMLHVCMCTCICIDIKIIYPSNCSIPKSANVPIPSITLNCLTLHNMSPY